jgi:hypothetical protein
MARSGGRGLDRWSTGGKIIAYSAAGIFVLLTLVQLIHLAQIAVTLVSLLVLLRLLGIVSYRW